VTSLSPSHTFPPDTLRVPARTSTSSLCPFPLTPAMPRISPWRSSNDTPLSACTPRSESAVRFSTRNDTAPGLAGFFSTRSSTARPTIAVAISAWFVSLVIRCPCPWPAGMLGDAPRGGPSGPASGARPPRAGGRGQVFAGNGRRPGLGGVFCAARQHRAADHRRRILRLVRFLGYRVPHPLAAPHP